MRAIAALVSPTHPRYCVFTLAAHWQMVLLAGLPYGELERWFPLAKLQVCVVCVYVCVFVCACVHVCCSFVMCFRSCTSWLITPSSVT
jgi:hypothetical protein